MLGKRRASLPAMPCARILTVSQPARLAASKSANDCAAHVQRALKGRTEVINNSTKHSERKIVSENSREHGLQNQSRPAMIRALARDVNDFNHADFNHA
jgi:hypothetical protein